MGRRNGPQRPPLHPLCSDRASTHHQDQQARHLRSKGTEGKDVRPTRSRGQAAPHSPSGPRPEQRTRAASHTLKTPAAPLTRPRAGAAHPCSPTRLSSRAQPAGKACDSTVLDVLPHRKDHAPNRPDPAHVAGSRRARKPSTPDHARKRPWKAPGGPTEPQDDQTLAVRRPETSREAAKRPSAAPPSRRSLV